MTYPPCSAPQKPTTRDRRYHESDTTAARARSESLARQRTRGLLTKGTLRHYITELSVTGLTSNPTIFDHAIKNTDFYDDAILEKVREGKSGEELFFELALEDLTQAADLFRPIHDATGGVDGWVSLEVSPLLAYDTAGSIKEAAVLYARANRPNLFIKIPGTREGLPAIEETVFAGVPVNVTLLFSREQYIAAAVAYMRGIERRIEAGLGTKVGSVASLFISRWDKAVMGKVPGSFGTVSVLPSPKGPTKPIGICLSRPGGRNLPEPGRSRSASCWPAPERKTPRLRTSFTSRPSPPRTPSTRCPRRHCSLSPVTAK